MQRKRFEFALERLTSGDWQRFENLASTFLSAEYPELRTLASPGGDAGRDGSLFGPVGDDSVALQYSVAAAWKAKIIRTAKRLKEAHPSVSLLIYVSNLEIGAAADDTKKMLRKELNIFLDVRDRSWFLERANSDNVRESAAEDLATAIVDPHLAEREVISAHQESLTSDEARAALVYLGLQWEDETRAKGLTRLCFEALVRAVLRDTDSTRRVGRTSVHGSIAQILPNHPEELIVRYTDSALGHLSKSVVKHWKAEDEFCLAHPERIRLNGRIIEVGLAESRLNTEIDSRITALMTGAELKLNSDDLRSRARRIIDAFFMSRGELFASMLSTGDTDRLALADISEFVNREVVNNPVRGRNRADTIEAITQLVSELLREPGEATHAYLGQLRDAYTLFAFLREAPDVQAATKKLFSFGDVWLDTNVVLPLIAEELVDSERQQFRPMLLAARDAGIKLHITDGVLEEVERHMNRAITCARGVTGEWKGSIPFLYAVYVHSGRAPQTFGSWLENFRGNSRPEDDIAQYLSETFAIELTNLTREVGSAAPELRGAVQEVWHSAHETRRDTTSDDPLTMLRLVAHDVENYLGVIERRRSQERASPLGYTSWWLTLDRVAFQAQTELRTRLVGDPPPSPVMSPDFLINYLAFGPIRARVPHGVESRLPLLVDMRLVETLPTELLVVAERVRAQNLDRSERVIRRMVRDELDAAKSRIGLTAKSGLRGVQDRLTTQR